MPRFSVVLPTHSRADLLQHSLAAALEQSFDDYEVIVSNNASEDHTEQVVGSFDDPRLKLVRTDRLLSMVDHWEFAVSRASGDWILLVCDDDALFPGSLARLEAIIDRSPEAEIVQFDRLRYVYGDGVRAEGNYVELGSRLTRGLQTMDSASRLRTVFWRMSIDMPKMLNSAVHRNLLERTRNRFRGVFAPWAPDLTVGVRLLAGTRSYLKTGPLMLWGENMRSYGSGARRDPDRLLEFFGQFPEFDGTLPHSPYPELITVTNAIFDTLCRLRNELGPEYGRLQINPVRFRRQLLRDIDHYVERGHDRFRAESDRIRRDLQRYRLKQGLDLVGGIKRAAERARVIPDKLHRLTAGRKTKGRKRRHRFENIHEAARFVGTLPEA